MLSLKCAVRYTKISKFIKQQEASGLLSSLGIKNTFKLNSLKRHCFILEVCTS